MNITTSIRTAAQTRPDALALIRADGLTLTYHELDRTLDVIAARLSAAGLQPRDVVLVGVARPYRHLILALALARAGITFAPLALPTTSAA
ncbi:MAG: AMP-binding protein, partial [Betaproteobacteria bacterium]